MNSVTGYTKLEGYKIEKNDIELFEEKYSLYGISRFTKRDWVIYYKKYHNKTYEEAQKESKLYVTRKLIC